MCFNDKIDIDQFLYNIICAAVLSGAKARTSFRIDGVGPRRLVTVERVSSPVARHAVSSRKLRATSSIDRGGGNAATPYRVVVGVLRGENRSQCESRDGFDNNHKNNNT